MIENLLANAIKYGSKSDPVTLELKHDDNTVKISVRNFGNPISNEDQKTIFDPFYRISNPQSTSLEGWGIGLTLVRGLARAHGGDISVTSSLESGTCFTISLPIISLE
jgi:signal transduction histidine kinase